MAVFRFFNNWYRYRTMVAELSRLSNDQLRDLGIARGEIYGIARQFSGF